MLVGVRERESREWVGGCFVSVSLMHLFVRSGWGKERGEGGEGGEGRGFKMGG